MPTNKSENLVPIDQILFMIQRYLRENGLIAKSAVPKPDERDPILSTWLKEHSLKGLPDYRYYWHPL